MLDRGMWDGRGGAESVVVAHTQRLAEEGRRSASSDLSCGRAGAWLGRVADAHPRRRWCSLAVHGSVSSDRGLPWSGMRIHPSDRGAPITRNEYTLSRPIDQLRNGQPFRNRTRSLEEAFEKFNGLLHYLPVSLHNNHHIICTNARALLLRASFLDHVRFTRGIIGRK